MKNEKSSKTKDNLATGASSAVGAAIGVVGGAAIATPEVEAAETQEFDINDIDGIEEPESDDMIIVDVDPDSQFIETDAVTVDMEVEVEPEIELIAYQTVEYEDGTIGSAAALNVNGTDGVLLDTTGDGKADIALVDLNHDGEIQDDEVFDASDANIEMSQFQNTPTQGDLYAANDMPDYINNADADTYMA